MRSPIKRICVFMVLLCLGILAHSGAQEPKWKGAVETKEGAKTIVNPTDPLYGELSFELKEDLSIGNEQDENYLFHFVDHMTVDKNGNIYVVDWGKKHIQMFNTRGEYIRTFGRGGQGPGEFGIPEDVFVNDLNGEIYVPDAWSIKVFSANSDYQRSIPLKKYNRSYCISPGGVIIAETDKPIFKESDKEQIAGILSSLRFINNTDGSESTVASFPDQLSKHIEGRPAKFTHGYEHSFHVSAIDPQTFVYGFSSDYLLNIIDSSGKLLLRIEKEGPPLSISEKEKDAVREKYRHSPIKNVNNIPFPKHKPYFGGILTGGDWIFVKHYRSPQVKKEIWTTDIFSTQGYYLYTGILPVEPKLIKNGFLYSIKTSDETGITRIKRYKIENWELLKKRSPTVR